MLGLVQLVYFAFDYADSVRWAIGIPVIVLMFFSLAAASIYGSYAGAKVAWEVTGGKPLKMALAELMISQRILSWCSKGKAPASAG